MPSVKSSVQVEENDAAGQPQNNIYWIQYATATSASMVMGMVGIHFGWIAPSLQKLMQHDSPIQISSSQSAWTSSYLQVGAIIGPFIGYTISDQFGRKRAIILFAMPNLGSHLLLYMANEVWMLYLARFFCGIAVGMAFVVVPIYISEISAPEIRGQLGLIWSLTMKFGLLLEYIIVPILSIKANAMVCFAIGVVQLILVHFIPETPYFHIMNNHDDKAAKSLMFLRRKTSCTDEINHLKNGWIEQQADFHDGKIFDIFKTKLNLKCLMLISIVIFAQQFTGIAAINSYIFLILDAAQSPISTEMSVIILTVFLAFITLILSVFIDRWGRRPLFIASTILSAIALTLMGIFFYLKHIKYENIDTFSLLPIVSLTTLLFAFHVGLGPLVYIFSSEIFATKYKVTAGMMLSIAGSILGIIVTKLYQEVADNIGLYCSLWIFAVCCVVSTIFIAVFIPETKNKSLEQIQIDLKAEINEKNT